MRAEVREGEYQRVRPGADPLNYTDADVETVRGPREYLVRVATLEEAHGLWFLCPLCFQRNGGAVGTHFVMIGFAGKAPPGTMSKNKAGADTRWSVSGSRFEDLTLQPSILLDGEGCGWHGFVTNGDAA